MDQSPSGSNANTSRRPKIVRSSSNHELIRTLLMNQPDSTQFSTISKPSDALAPREHSAAGVNSYSNSSRRIGNVPPLRTPNSSKSHGGLRTSTSTASSGKCPHCNVTLKWPNGLRKHVENIHNRRSTEFHCERCSFKHKSKQKLEEHQNAKHHTCPYCKGLFSRLEQHLPSCSKKAGQRQWTFSQQHIDWNTIDIN